MITEEAISDKILSLPFGVVLAVIFILAIIFTSVVLLVASMISINPSLLIIVMLIGFAVVRLIYFAITRK